MKNRIKGFDNFSLNEEVNIYGDKWEIAKKFIDKYKHNPSPYELEEFEKSLSNNLPYKKQYPFICEFKNRKPNPGQCYVLEIDFEERKLVCSNGAVRLFPSFDDVIIKRFTLSTDEETIYVPVDFQ